MNQLVCLGFSIIEASKILIYESWYDYVKPKYGEKAKLCYMDTNSSIEYIKKHHIYKHVEARYDYELDKMLPKSKMD